MIWRIGNRGIYSNGRETADTFHAGTVAEDGFGRVQAVFGRYGASVQEV